MYNGDPRRAPLDTVGGNGISQKKEYNTKNSWVIAILIAAQGAENSKVQA